MLALYLILFGCLLGNQVHAMDEESPTLRRSNESKIFHDSNDDSQEYASQQVSPGSRAASIKAQLEAEHAYEAELMVQLYNDEISHEEFNAYFDNKALNLFLQIIPQVHLLMQLKIAARVDYTLQFSWGKKNQKY